MSKKIWYLQQIDLFRGLDKKRLDEIESFFYMKEYCRGEVVFEPGDSDKIFIVKSGKVEVFQLSSDGKKFIVEVLTKGSIFGDISPGEYSDTYVEVLNDAYICSLDRDKFFQIISSEPSVSEKLMRYLFERLVVTEKKIASLATDNVLKQLIKLLLRLGKPNGSKTPDKLTTDSFTHEQLAQMLGISRQTVTTLLNDLQRQGLVHKERKQFSFMPEELKQLAV